MSISSYAARSAHAALEPFNYEPGALGAEEVEVQVSHCGICHSDLSMIDNEWKMTKYPLVPGHEVVGNITAVGTAVHTLQVGQRVGIGWQCGSCGECHYCGIGKEHFCAKEQDTIVQHHGGFGERVRAQAKFAVPLPEALDAASAAPLLCAGNTVFAPMMHHGVNGSMSTAVVGIGGLGHIAVQFLAKLGCEVTAVSSTHAKDAETRGFGASDFIATKGTSELKKATNRFDFIISTVSADLPWPDYVAALKPEGTLVIVGVPESPVAVPAFSLIGGERVIAGGRASSPADIVRMFDFAARHGVRAQIEKFPMHEVNAALDRVRSGQARYRVVLEA